MNIETNISWQDFIAQQFSSFNTLSEAAPANNDNFITALTDQSLISVSGEDAADFLHKQFSNDVERLPSHQARLAAYCTAKGRMLASLMYWKTSQGISLQIHRSIDAAIQKRLQMFVMRSKVQMRNANEEQVILGLVGQNLESKLANWFPELPSSDYAIVSNQFGELIRFPQHNAAVRLQWITSPAIAMQVWPELAKSLAVAAPSAWNIQQIRAGLPQIVQATQEKFVPQMLNFEVIGGVNFKKGCYPGQEIVARSQYLGKLKRRMSIATIAHAVDAAPKASDEIFSKGDPEQACGMIVNAERLSETESICLAEIKVAELESHTIHFLTAEGPALAFLPLPYEIIDVTA